MSATATESETATESATIAATVAATATGGTGAMANGTAIVIGAIATEGITAETTPTTTVELGATTTGRATARTLIHRGGGTAHRRPTQRHARWRRRCVTT